MKSWRWRSHEYGNDDEVSPLACFFHCDSGGIVSAFWKTGGSLMKRGELTTTQIVTLVLLIASFLIILYFIFLADFGKTTDKELCHNSVVTRSESVLPTDAIELECKTSYVCLTEDGSCDVLTNPEIVKVSSKDEVYEALARELAECWWMFGEGKYEYVSKDFLPGNLYCSVCSQIAFDDSVRERVFQEESPSLKEFFTYLSTHNLRDSAMTYATYLFGSDDSASLETALSQSNATFDSLDLQKQYYVLMGITAEVSTLGYVAVGAAVVGGAAFALISAPASWPATVGILVKTAAVAGGAAVGGVGGYFAGVSVEGSSGNDFLVPTLVEVNSQSFEAYSCEDVVTLA